MENLRMSCPSCGSSLSFSASNAVTIACNVCGQKEVVIEADGIKEISISCLGCGSKTLTISGGLFCPHHNIAGCRGPYTIDGAYIDTSVQSDTLKNARPFVRVSRLKSSFDVSVLILCHNKITTTEKCLDHVFRMEGNYEVIVLDNGSTNHDDVNKIKKYSDRASVLFNSNNIGCTLGRNQIAGWARGKFLLFLDNDQFVPPELIRRMIDVDSDIVGVEAWEVASKSGEVAPRGDLLSKCSYVGAGGMLVNRVVWEYLGGFDERFAPAWYEDPDFCLRARYNGFTLGVLPNSRVIHKAHSTIHSQNTFSSTESKYKSRRLFCSIWSKYLFGGSKEPEGAKPSEGQKGGELFVTHLKTYENIKDELSDSVLEKTKGGDPS